MFKFLQRINSKIFFQNIERDLQDIKLKCWHVQKHIEQMHEHELREAILKKQPNSLIKYGFSVYSQNDEDGIIQHIFEKLDIPFPNFIEFGVGATENNSMFLLIKGSKGVWVDGNIDAYREEIKCDKLKMTCTFVTRENVLSIMNDAVTFVGVERSAIDFVSMDLDGNDYYFIEEMINNAFLPKLLCLEYNAKFRDAIVKVPYRENSSWSGDDFFGCSLGAYCDLLKKDYALLVCNITGANAFFIRNDLKNKFEILEPMELYQPPRYYFSSMYKGHQPSNKYLNHIAENKRD